MLRSTTSVNDPSASTKPVKQLSDLAEFKNLKDAWESVASTKDWFAAAQKAGDGPGLQLTIFDLGLQHQQLEVQRLQLQLDQANAYMVLLTPLLPPPEQQQWRAELAQIAKLMRDRFYDRSTNFFWGTLARKATEPLMKKM